MQILFRLLFAAGLLCRTTAWCADSTQPKSSGPTEEDLFGDKVLARGKGLEIKRSELDRCLLIQVPVMLRQRGIPADMADQFALNELIHYHLLLARATDAEKKDAKAKVEKIYEEKKKGMDAEIRLTALSAQEYLKQLADTMTAQAVARREIPVSVSDADARRYYETNSASFQVPESVHGNYILVPTRDFNTGLELSQESKDAQLKKAEQALKRARSGEDFVKLVDQVSEEPSAKQTHGDFTLRETDTSVAPETRLAIFALATNQVSDLITTPRGYCIFKLKERVPAGKLQFEKVVADLKTGLTNQAIAQELPHFLDKLWKDADVVVLDDKLKLKLK